MPDIFARNQFSGTVRSAPTNFQSSYESSYVVHIVLRRTSRVWRGGKALVVRQDQPFTKHKGWGITSRYQVDAVNLLEGNIGENSLASPNQFLDGGFINSKKVSWNHSKRVGKKQL